MTGLRDILANTLPITALVRASALCLLLATASVSRADALDTAIAIECALGDTISIAPADGCEWAQGRVVTQVRR